MSVKKVLPKGRRYTEQQREQAVRLVQLAREEGRGYAAVQRIAVQLECPGVSGQWGVASLFEGDG